MMTPLDFRIDQLEKAIKQLDANISKHTAIALYESVHDEKEEHLKRVLARKAWVLQNIGISFEKGTAYTQIVMVGGYAAYFGIWQLSAQYLEAPLIRLSGLLMLISLTAFIGWEIIKMFIQAHVLKRMEQLLREPDDSFDDAMQSFSEWQSAYSVRHSKFWVLALVISVPTACLAIYIHIWAFFRGGLVI